MTPCSRQVRNSSGGLAQDEEDKGEVLEENEAFSEELEVEHQEAVAMMTLARPRRAEVNRARQFSRKPQSSEDSKARLDKLKQKLPCARCGQLGQWKDDNDCQAKVKVVNWRKPKSFQFLQSLTSSGLKFPAVVKLARCAPFTSPGVIGGGYAFLNFLTAPF